MTDSRAPTAKYDADEHARRGDEIYERQIRATVEPQRDGDFIAIDVESGDYEVSADERDATERLIARRPDAQIWLRRVGSPYAYRIGFAPPPR